jgi:hypothetical protein
MNIDDGFQAIWTGDYVQGTTQGLIDQAYLYDLVKYVYDTGFNQGAYETLKNNSSYVGDSKDATSI